MANASFAGITFDIDAADDVFGPTARYDQDGILRFSARLLIYNDADNTDLLAAQAIVTPKRVAGSKTSWPFVDTGSALGSLVVPAGSGGAMKTYDDAALVRYEPSPHAYQSGLWRAEAEWIIGGAP